MEPGKGGEWVTSVKGSLMRMRREGMVVRFTESVEATWLWYGDSSGACEELSAGLAGGSEGVYGRQFGSTEPGQ